MSDAPALAIFAALLDDDAERHYHHAPCGFLSTTPEGLILRVNDTLLALTGYRREDLVGERRFADLLSGGGRIYHETHLAPMLRMEGKASEIALELVCADDSRLPVLINSVLDRDDQGNPTVIRTAVFEATARREYERELLLAKQRAESSEARAKALARTLQQTLIPPELPQIPGIELAAAYRPAGDGEEIGGEFYDVFELSADDWVVAIGDVCGKGVDAAIMTSLARHTLRAAAVRSPRPYLALEMLNEVLLRDDSDRFCTATFLRLRRGAGGWTVTSSSGGHPLPLLVRRGEHPVEIGRPGSLLGVFAEPSLGDSETTTLRPGDAIVLHTDGVTEGRRAGRAYGDARLKSLLARSDGGATVLAEDLLADALGFQGGNPNDDIAIVAISVPIS